MIDDRLSFRSYFEGTWHTAFKNAMGWYINWNPETCEPDAGMQMGVVKVWQCTGQKDRAGDPIFEGDILRMTMPDGEHVDGVVRWCQNHTNGFSIITINGPRGGGSSYSLNFKDTSGSYNYPSRFDEIVGNAMENPEMVERCTS